MVSAVRCPNPKCRKYMLVEETDRGRVLGCLICKQPIQVPGPAPVTAAAAVAAKPQAAQSAKPPEPPAAPSFILEDD